MRAALIISGFRRPPRGQEVIVMVEQRGQHGGDFWISPGAWNRLYRALRNTPGIEIREVR